MTPERINELRALEAAATPGPWTIVDGEHDTTTCESPLSPGTYDFVWREGWDYDDYGAHPNKADAAFIAAARTALPEALDAIERVRAYCDEILTSQPNFGDCSAREVLAALEGKP